MLIDWKMATGARANLDGCAISSKAARAKGSEYRRPVLEGGYSADKVTR